MVEAFLIGRPKFDFDTLFRGANQALGRSLTKAIDKATGPVSDPQRLVSALASFLEANNLSVMDQMREADHELFFLHYTFLMYADKDTAFKVREWTKLDVSSTAAIDGEIIFFAAGSLSEWKRAASECCTEKAPFNVRLLFDKVVLRLEAEGVGPIWFDQRKRTLADRTFLLEDKR